MTTKTTPEFAVVPRRRKTAVPTRPRRSWSAVVDALVAGRRLFLSDTDLSDRDVKYLQLALARRGKNERLRTERSAKDGVNGRDIWAVVGPEATPIAVAVVEA